MGNGRHRSRRCMFARKLPYDMFSYDVVVIINIVTG